MIDSLHTEIGKEPYDESNQHDDIIIEGSLIVLGIGFVVSVTIFVLAVVGIIKKLRK